MYLHKPVYISARQASSSFEHAACIIYYYMFLPLCAHILYFDAAKFSIKLFSLVYFSVSVVRQWNKYEIVIETGPLKGYITSPFQDVNLYKNPSSDKI